MKSLEFIKKYLNLFGACYLEKAHLIVIKNTVLILILLSLFLGGVISNNLVQVWDTHKDIKIQENTNTHLAKIEEAVEENKLLNLKLNDYYSGITDYYTQTKFDELVQLDIGDPIIINKQKYRIKKSNIEVTFKYSKNEVPFNQIGSFNLPVGSLLKLNGEILYEAQEIYFKSFLTIKDSKSNTKKKEIIIQTTDKEFALMWGTRIVESIILEPIPK